MPLEYTHNYFYVTVHYAESTSENSGNTKKILKYSVEAS
jgi:hypothetical protein